ncbi:MAG: hypothetical protein WAU00_13905 [Caldilinea sp.]|nr:hypothetical protein [Anaerolineales bacterium]HRA65984.1 hypothetical protein [Caldilinea sp.]
MSISPSLAPETVSPAGALFPVETDIYILPDGRVVVADLPAELADRLARLGHVEPCEITSHDTTHPITGIT